MGFKYQEWKKEESEQRIINSLSEGDKMFSELLELTDLSKPVLSRRLKELKKKGNIDVVPDKETKRFFYSLIPESLDNKERMRLNLSKLTRFILEGLEQKAKDPTISDGEYLNWLTEVMTSLFNLRLWGYIPFMSISEEKEWWRSTFGSELVNRLPYILPAERLERLKNIIERENLPFPLFEKVSPEDIEEYVASIFKKAMTKKD